MKQEQKHTDSTKSNNPANIDTSAKSTNKESKDFCLDSKKVDSAFGALQVFLYEANIQNPKWLQMALGYQSAQKYEKILHKFFSKKSLCEWLLDAHYDLTHNAKSFLECCKRFVNVEILEIEIAAANAHIERINKLKRGVIRIKNNFRRGDKPIFMLAMTQNMLFLPICRDKKDYFLSDSELIFATQNRLAEHFATSKGKIGYPWRCDILGYEMHFCGRKIDFDTQGEILLDSANKHIKYDKNLLPKSNHPSISLKVGSRDIAPHFQLTPINPKS